MSITTMVVLGIALLVVWKLFDGVLKANPILLICAALAVIFVSVI